MPLMICWSVLPDPQMFAEVSRAGVRSVDWQLVLCPVLRLCSVQSRAEAKGENRESVSPEQDAGNPKVYVSNLQPASQAGCYGFDPRLPLKGRLRIGNDKGRSRQQSSILGGGCYAESHEAQRGVQAFVR